MKIPNFSSNVRIIWILLLGIFGVCAFWYANMSTRYAACLTNDEKATYEVVDKSRPGKVVVKVLNKDDLPQKTIGLTVLQPDHYHLVEMRPCGIYYVGAENYDPAVALQRTGYRETLQRTDYSGKTDEVLLLGEKVSQSVFNSIYKRDFRVSHNENHIALVSSGSGGESERLVVKEVSTGGDSFSLPMSSIIEESSNRAGVIDLIGWTMDSRYFWAGTSETAYVKSYIRVDTHDWSYEIFDAPDGAMGGSSLNLEKGLIPINPGGQWTGSAEMDEILTQSLRKEGFVNKLYLYDLFKKDQILITETKDEPMFWFEPTWLSDTELEYTMPDGTKKIYRVE